jgi:hypothetical protein
MAWNYRSEHFSDFGNEIEQPEVKRLMSSFYVIVSRIANLLLNQWLDDARTVYRAGQGEPWHEKKTSKDSQMGKIILIEKLV